MSFVVRRVLPLLAIAAVTVAASCEPAKKSPPLPLKDTPPTGQGGENVAYYFAVDGDNPTTPGALRQSPSPFTAPVCGPIKSTSAGGPGSRLVSGPGSLFGEASQTLNPDGSVTLDVVFPDGSTCVGVSGFAVVVTTLGDLTTSTVGTTPGSDQVASILAFDVDKNGQFGGEFNADGTNTGPGDDVVCGRGGPATLAAPGGNDLTTIDDATNFRCEGDDYTLPDLRAGVMGLGSPGVDDTTPVAILVGLPTMNGGDVNATVNSFKLNGVEQL